MMSNVDLFFQMMEHPDQYTDKQWRDILADKECHELYTLMSKTKSALDTDDIDKGINEDTVNDDWKKFEQENFKKQDNRSWLKIAAMFIGVIFISGAAFALAIQIGIVNNPFKTKMPTPTTQGVSPKPSANIGGDSTRCKDGACTVSTDTITFDNAELGQIMEDMSAYYHTKCVFNNNTARHIRLYFVWVKQSGLQHNIELLNEFDRINISYEDNTITIE